MEYEYVIWSDFEGLVRVSRDFHYRCRFDRSLVEVAREWIKQAWIAGVRVKFIK